MSTTAPREIGEQAELAVDREAPAYPIRLGLSLPRSTGLPHAHAPQPPLTVLIFARDETAVLGETLRRLNGCLGPDDGLHVVADHCSDGTVDLARSYGATVYERIAPDGLPGKGGALRWWVDQTRGDSDCDRPVVILDADSLPSPGLLDGLRVEMATGVSAAQAEIRPLVAFPSPVSLLAAYSDVTEQRVFDAWRARLGWPVRLRGTGMAIQRRPLERAAARLSTRAEDIELTVLLGSWGASIHPAPHAYVYDPKPPDTQGAIRQRARWLQGQAGVIRRHPSAVTRLVLRGPAGWSLLESLFLRPKAFFLPAKAAAAAAAWALAVTAGSILYGAVAVLASLWLASDLAGLAAGLRHMPDMGEALRALAAWPLYVGVWVRSLFLSAVSRDPWLRSRAPTSRTAAPRGEDGR